MKALFISLVCICTAMRLGAQSTPISPLIMGQAYWWTDWDDGFGNNESTLGTAWPKVKESNVVLVRAGGKGYNVGNEKPQGGQEVYYVSIADDIRKNFCEPVLTLPFLLKTYTTSAPEPNVGDPLFTAAVAASINTLQTILRLTNEVHKRNVKYVILGNEPDLDYKWKVQGTLTAVQVASNIAGYIKPMADAVRQMTSTIGAVKIIGPENADLLPEVYDLLFTPSNTATYIGGISPVTNKPYLDYASFHFYGPSYNQNPNTNSYNPPPPSSWTSSLTFCNIERYAKDWYEPIGVVRRYRGAMHYMQRKVAESTQARGQHGALGWMVTEMNPGLKTELANTSSINAAANAAGFDGISMQGAQNLARMYALAMEYGAASIMMWSVQESDPNEDRGYLVGQGTTDNGSKRPTWYHYKMLAEYFKGRYHRDEVFATHVASGSNISISSFDANPNSASNETRGPEWLHYKSGTTFTTNFESNLENLCETKAFAAQNTSVAVMILNHSSSSVTAVLKFDGTVTFSNSADKKFSFNMNKSWGEILLDDPLGNGDFAAIDANSTHIIIFDCSGNIQRRYRYRLSPEASTYNTVADGFYGTGNPGTFTSAISGTVCYPGSRTISVTPGYSPYSWKLLPDNSATVTTAAQLSSQVAGSYEITVNTGCGVAKATAVLHQNSPLANPGVPVDLCTPPHTVTLGDPFMPPPPTYTYSWQSANNSYSTSTIALNLTTTPVKPSPHCGTNELCKDFAS